MTWKYSGFLVCMKKTCGFLEANKENSGHCHYSENLLFDTNSFTCLLFYSEKYLQTNKNDTHMATHG